MNNDDTFKRSFDSQQHCYYEIDQSENSGSYEKPAAYKPPTSKMYLLVALAASIFLTIGVIIRGVESKHLLVAKCTLCLASLTTGLVYIISVCVYRHFNKGDYANACVVDVLPWYQNGVFVPRILQVLMLRGLLEFGGSLMFIYSLRIALDFQINQGICSSCMTIAVLMITVMSYYAYNEKINAPQGIGMIIILIGVVLMGAFQEENTDEVPQEQTDDHYMPKNVAMILLIVFACLAAFTISLESMFIRWGASRGIPGEVGAYMTLLFDGVYGTIILIVLQVTGNGWQVLDSTHQIWFIYIGGFFTCFGLVLVNWSVANGIAGMSFSVANAYPVWHTMFNYFILGQMISGNQAIGIAMAVSGGIVISLSQQLDCCSKEPVEEDNTFKLATMETIEEELSTSRSLNC